VRLVVACEGDGGREQETLYYYQPYRVDIYTNNISVTVTAIQRDSATDG
jgi:hypothetical protein